MVVSEEREAVLGKIDFGLVEEEPDQGYDS